jgi:ABC-2 type transport system ATP-binding protein
MRADVSIAVGRVIPRGGHHGLRLVAGLLILIAIVVVVVLLVRAVRRRRGRSPAAGETAPHAPAALPRVPSVSGPPAALPRVPSVSGPPAPLPRVPGVTGPRADGGTIGVRSLSKHYGAKVAVDGLSFDVLPGRVTGFLGPNGAGKSTTMRVIMGLDAATTGTATVNGRRYHDLPWPMREVGALLEARAIHPGRSAYAHLWMLAQTNDIPRRRVDEVLGLVGLSEVAHQRAGQFSLGMGQRLGMAAALLGDPDVLLFDEPVNGLDTDGIRWVRQLLRDLADEGRTVLVSSHLMNEMAITADHVVVIAKGRLVADLPTSDFTAHYTRSAVRVRSRYLDRLVPALTAAGASARQEADGSVTVSGLDPGEVGEVACRESIALSELSPQTATLEQAFIESTEGALEFRGGRPLAGVQPGPASVDREPPR